MKNMPEYKRFVIHKHMRGEDIHWDLMIEWGDVLKTWRLENPPEKLTGDFDKLSPGKTKATPIQDHDKKFLTYQGPVNNGTGTAEIVDEGTCTIELDDGKILKVDFAGRVLKSQAIIEVQK
ncbi:MAG: hypothetical protein BWY69_01737 [Planctomycetes bacterium ADurb.Bin401]|nr:MAG: hypothetical protein BWY69_01737 [Planctomycetes bacterium ADurb.Bin401]